MNLVAYPAAQAMTSREIAIVVESRHDKVKQSIERLVAKGVISSPPVGNFKNINNVTGTEYLVCKRDSYVIVAQLSPEFTARLVDRWQELEAQQQAQTSAKPRELSRMDLIQIAMEAEQERLLLAAKVEEMKPSVAALERLTKADGSMCITDAAKQLQTTPKKLFALLSVEGWIYRRQGTSWIAYQEKIQAGLLEHKLSVIERTDGTEKTVSQVRITPKGMAKAGKMLESLTVAA